MSDTNLCPACERPVPQGEDICPLCEQLLCPECGAALDEDDFFCPRCGIEFALVCDACGSEVDAGDTVCPNCGSALEQEETPEAQNRREGEDDAEETAVPLWLDTADAKRCPACQTPIYLEDGFCSGCGAMLCTACGQIIDEDDDTCPHCHARLYFDCPNCGFELTAGADHCPHCNALVPSFCTHCTAPLPAGAQHCPACGKHVTASVRATVRIVHSLVVGDQIVRMAACPDCGDQFDLSAGSCATCGFRVCPQCQIHLQSDESICPRCGPTGALQITAPERLWRCQVCQTRIAIGSDECPNCHQLLCPECGAIVREEDTSCTRCGTEFEFTCPQCETIMSPTAEICPTCGQRF